MIAYPSPGTDPRARDIRSWDGTPGDLDRYLADRQALSERLDEESLILGLGWSPSVCATHEAMLPWDNATSSRWYRALPERWMVDLPAEMRQAAEARHPLPSRARCEVPS
jgi:hypothetical protein